LIESEADIAKVAMEFPLFLKPVSEGSGKGVDARSRVANRGEMQSVARDLLARFRQPVLVEEFLPGREFTVGITGTGDAASVLGVIEIVPTGKYVGHGYGLENKADWEGKLDIVPVDDAEARAAAAVALAAWKVLRCRDGGRADIRLDRDGSPCFIEVNPLAGIRPGYSDLCFIADFQKISYQELIGKFLASFIARRAA
jgi:D-alanine-D-alanine ligase